MKNESKKLEENEYEDFGEELLNSGFTPFNIEELNKQSILDEDIFQYVLSIDDQIQKTRILVQLQNKAKELKVIRAFDKLFKAYQTNYVQKIKGKGSNTMQFTNPPIANLKCGKWTCRDTGVTRIAMVNFEPQTIVACPHPILPIERLINVDTNIEKVKLAFFKDNKWQNVITERNTIASKSKILQLANRGIEVNESNAKELINYLADVINLNVQEIPILKGITHLGWVNDEFVPYTDNYILDSEDTGFKKIYNSVKSHGDYETWKSLMKELRKNKAIKFMMAASFASPFVKKFGINPFIVHLWGISGSGKTVVLKICTSIWANPEKGYMSTANSTNVANERIASFFRNMPLIIDEFMLKGTRYKDNDEMIYALTEGKGKDRGNVDGGINQETEWKNITLTNGEQQLTSESSSEGVKNRVVEINEEGNLVEDGNGVCKTIAKNYGHAGKELISIIQTMEDEDIEKIRNNYTEKFKEITSYKKQINAMACIATIDYIVSKKIFNDEPITIEEMGSYFRSDTDETDRIMQIILDEFSVNANKFYDSLNNISFIGEIWGKVEKTTEKKEILAYYVPQTKLIEILEKRGCSWNAIKVRMAKKGYIEASEFKNGERTKMTYTVRELMAEGWKRVVKINAYKFNGDN